MTQADLFLTYPDKPGHVRGSDTSEAAADSIDAANLRGVILQLFRQCGAMTCDAVEEAMEGRHQTISPRIRELVMRGKLKDTGQRASTRSGRSARVYALADD
jgi:predicted HTH transcriptional regulator